MADISCDIPGYAVPQPAGVPAGETAVLEEPQVSVVSRLGAGFGGIVGAVCWGGGLAAVVATLAGSVSAMRAIHSSMNMQGLTLLSDVVAIGLLLALAWWQSRSFRSFLAPPDYRRVYGRTVYRLAIWALGGYMLYMVLSPMVMALFHFSYLAVK